MSAIVLPFPRSRDRAFISRHASIMTAAATTAKAEAHLRRQLELQRQTMERRGINSATIDAELQDIQGHVRAVVWSLLLAPGGAA
ncbi:hypothetical protein M446_3875 [Methylobacterium sp. 4-46]|uniref:DUF6074 family protein n=1 Tax=unclassified Methylobacterium TaxID=2615210 RepID=UPI000165CACC|nr:MULTISPECIES: DUF6074 family protein [Methylobacterium]ACA18248.1 hypothetical protein M446_3875 [Methylobacterium sp. 4-46]WFT77543.1 DUF6074 family protein [Methylobacterium nodulans]